VTEYPGYNISGLVIGASYTALLMVWREPGAPTVRVTPDNMTFGPTINQTSEWVESRMDFIASAESQRIGLARQDTNLGLVYLGAIFCTPAPYTGPYFDGSSGSDYIWGGAANASASFYYPDRVNRSYLISQLLEENCPLGVIPGVPQFGVLPTIGVYGDVWPDAWPDVWPGHYVSYY